MITSKQRSFLRAMANDFSSIIHIGKEGISDEVIKQIDDALEARELIKISLEKNSDILPRDAIKIICEALDAEPVQVIGRKVVVYRKSKTKPRIQI